jgi:hypothetical protein
VHAEDDQFVFGNVAKIIWITSDEPPPFIQNARWVKNGTLWGHQHKIIHNYWRVVYRIHTLGVSWWHSSHLF